jgi:hypothetical protein
VVNNFVPYILFVPYMVQVESNGGSVTTEAIFYLFDIIGIAARHSPGKLLPAGARNDK